VRSGFKLTTQEKNQIKEAIKKHLGDKEITYKENEVDLISGIELSFNDFNISWNIANYLEEFEANIKDYLNDQYKIHLHEQARIQEGA